MTLTGQVQLPLGRLRLALGADAVATGTTGLAYTVAAGPLGRWFDVSSELLLTLGIAFIGYGLAVAGLTAYREPPAPAVRTVVGLNAIWVALSLTALAAQWIDPSAVGTGWLVLKAGIVLGFALAQGLSLQRWLQTS